MVKYLPVSENDLNGQLMRIVYLCVQISWIYDLWDMCFSVQLSLVYDALLDVCLCVQLWPVYDDLWDVCLCVQLSSVYDALWDMCLCVQLCGEVVRGGGPVSRGAVPHVWPGHASQEDGRRRHQDSQNQVGGIFVKATLNKAHSNTKIILVMMGKQYGSSLGCIDLQNIGHTSEEVY